MRERALGPGKNSSYITMKYIKDSSFTVCILIEGKVNYHIYSEGIVENFNRPFATIDHVSNSPIATGLWRASFPDSP
jgi:hypothetical protein